MISEDYKKQLEKVHENKKWGNSGKSWIFEIEPFADKVGAKSIIDFGCGTGSLKKALEHKYDFVEYDPGIEGKETLPDSPADMLVATDVLEHVEPEFLDDTLKQIDSLYTRGAFLVIACNPAKETLPDGRNAHLIQEPPKWWASKFKNIDHFIDEKKRALIWLRKT